MAVVLGEGVPAVDPVGPPLGAPPADLSDKGVRAQLTPAAVTALFRLADAWGVTTSDVEGLLGFSVSQPTLQRWKKQPPSELSMDALQRISHLINIYRLTHIIFGAPVADAWVNVANHGPICRGVSPIRAIIRDGLPTLIALHEDLESMRGGW